MSRKTPEQEHKELVKSYLDLIEANTKLMNEKKWAIEDKQRLERRIKLALELIECKANYNQIKKALEEDYYDE